jgi:[ribosomal protein S18]-alanine N-acetyltransferase
MKLCALNFAHSDLVVALHDSVFDEIWSAKAFLNLIEMPATFGFISSVDDQPAGFILCQGDGEEAEVITIATHGAFRRQGVAQALLDRAFDCTKIMFLEVAADNFAARRLYEKNGFQRVGIRKKYYKRSSNTFIDALVLQKKK